MDDIEDLFGPVIYRYTDAEAIDDGVLVALSTTDRVTANAFNEIARVAEDQRDPPACWPVDLMGFIRARTGDDRALAMVIGLVDTQRHMALGHAGRVARYAVHGPHGYRELADVEPNDAATYQTLLLVANEVGGVTLMLTRDS